MDYSVYRLEFPVVRHIGIASKSYLRLLAMPYFFFGRLSFTSLTSCSYLWLHSR